MEINGMAHVILTASNFERSREFYRKLLPFLGMKPVIETDSFYYCVGGRTAVGIGAPASEFAGARFEQRRVGLHHLCFRARERSDVDDRAACKVHSARPAEDVTAGLERDVADRYGDRLVPGGRPGKRDHPLAL